MSLEDALQFVRETDNTAWNLLIREMGANRNGVANIHRFLVPLALNAEVSRALDRWARHFKMESLWVNTK